MNEDELLAWLAAEDPEVGAAIGDDAAFLPAAGPRAVTVDNQIEGVHFPPGLAPAVLANRLLAVNLSDLAAVGADPGYAFLSLAAPAGFDHQAFFRALLAACRRHHVQLAGGDLARSPLVHLTLTLLGELPPGGRFVRRDAALPGDGLWLGGSLGESAAGRLLLAAGATWRHDGAVLPPGLQLGAELETAARAAVRRHLLPSPQQELGCWLGSQPRAAAIDVSDGLGKDLGRLCRQSRVGARVAAEAIPKAPAFGALCQCMGWDERALVQGGGEDYVLLFTLPPESRPPDPFGCVVIGTIVKGDVISWIEGDQERDLSALGWDHLHTTNPLPSPVNEKPRQKAGFPKRGNERRVSS